MIDKSKKTAMKKYRAEIVLGIAIFILDIPAVIIGGTHAIAIAFEVSLLWLVVALVASFSTTTMHTTYEKPTGKVIGKRSWNEGIELAKITGLAPVRALLLYVVFALVVLAAMGGWSLYRIIHPAK